MNSNNIKKKKEIIELMAKNESKVSKLYRLYSKLFPEHSDFWYSISNDEVNHAKWLHEFSIKPDCLEVCLKDKFKKAPIIMFMQFLEKQISDAKEGLITPTEALSIGIDVEKSIIEKDFLEIFEPQTEKAEKTLSHLKRETKRHFDEMTSLLNETKRKKDLD